MDASREEEEEEEEEEEGGGRRVDICAGYSYIYCG